MKAITTILKHLIGYLKKFVLKSGTENHACLQHIEPHKYLLKQPNEDQMLFKIMTFENFLKCIDGNYLHFQRVDSYQDFFGADNSDGEQLPADLEGNEGAKFESNPNFSAADYYNRSRSRSYACCFSIENSEYIWQIYANDKNSIGKVCFAIKFCDLRESLNKAFRQIELIDCDNDIRTNCKQFFDINYGLINYIDKEQFQGNKSNLPNPIEYIYFKDKNRYSKEKEFRVSLSPLGIYEHFKLPTGEKLEFPKSIQFEFDFKSIFSSQLATLNVCSNNSHLIEHLNKELSNRDMTVIIE